MRTDGLRTALALVVATVTAACGASPITAIRLERAIAPTFANLVHIQLARLALSPLAAADINVIASCRRLLEGSSTTGAGDWECILVWHGPNQQVLRDTYDVAVSTNGCYTARLTGSESELGGPTVMRSDGVTTRNVVYAFDGCFDIT